MERCEFRAEGGFRYVHTADVNQYSGPYILSKKILLELTAAVEDVVVYEPKGSLSLEAILESLRGDRMVSLACPTPRELVSRHSKRPISTRQLKCAIHGLSCRSRPRRVYDTFLFSNEAEVCYPLTSGGDWLSGTGFC